MPGVNFSESFAPVVNDVTFWILLVAMVAWNLKVKIVDVETAFLYGDLEEEIYMDIPKGMDGDGNECVQLLKMIYG